jgi:outer membrane protein OmpA-like peptidoglycan-associated protein
MTLRSVLVLAFWMAQAVEHAGAQAANRAPTVTARCEPCTITAGLTATIRARAADPDGDPLTFRWFSSGGSLPQANAPVVTWTADTAEGLTMITVTVDDGHGGVASDTVTIAVNPPVEFEEVLFDLDSATLGDDTVRVLDAIVATFRANPQMRLRIEGHTCHLGTAEHNLALGERRARAVEEHLVRRGVDAERISTVSYGEERPAYDNTTESTRRLNRRVVFLVTIGTRAPSDAAARLTR